MGKLGILLTGLLVVLPACKADSGSGQNTTPSARASHTVAEDGLALSELGTGGPVAKASRRTSIFSVNKGGCSEPDPADTETFGCEAPAPATDIVIGPSRSQRALLKELNKVAHDDWMQLTLVSKNGKTVQMLSAECDGGESELSNYVGNLSERLREGSFVEVVCVTDEAPVFTVSL